MLFQLRMIVVVEALDGRFLDCSVHSLDLPIGPGVLHLCQPVLDIILVTDPVEDVVGGIFIALLIGELDAIIGEDDVDAVGHGGDQIAQELGGIHLSGFVIEFDEGKFGCPVNRHKEIEFALGRLDLGNIDMEIADRITFELLLRLLVAFDLRQT